MFTKRKILLSSAAVGLALAVSAKDVQAQDTGFYGSLEGAFLFSEIDDLHGNYNGSAAGYSYRTDGETDWGLAGRARAGITFGPWSVGVGGVFEWTEGDDSSGPLPTSGTGGYDYDVDSHFYAVDFEVGYDFGLGGDGASIRPFIGVRYAQLDLDQEGQSTTYYNCGCAVSVDMESQAWGVGPRLGADVRVPLGESFALDVNGSGFVLFGERERVDEAQFTNYPAYPTYKNDDSDTFWGFEASIGPSWVFNMGPEQTGAVTLGYRMLWINDFVEGEQTLYNFRRGDQEDYFTHGPFLRVSVGM